jgi:hypothetical protein
MALQIPDARDATFLGDQESIKPPEYSQIFSLQRRDQNGFFRKVETFHREINPEDVLSKYGPGYYILRSCVPRFKTIWKKQLGQNQHHGKLETLDKRTKYLVAGLGGLAFGEVVGFGLTHSRFQKMEERVDEIETALQGVKPSCLKCWNCGSDVEYFLQRNCTHCGCKLGWPKHQLPVSLSSQECPSCGFPLLSHQMYCPNCGQQRPIPTQFASQTTSIFGLTRVTGGSP